MPHAAKVTTMGKACIGYLASDPEELARFMTQAGYDPDGLRAALGSRELDVAVLDYFAANEPALLAMCANSDVSVDHFMRVWREVNRHD